MGLLYWLPLTKDLRNQGINNTTVTNNGATFDSAGKLGGCYSFNGSSNYLTIPQGYLGANWSYALWVYTTTNDVHQTLGCCRTKAGTGFSIFLLNSGKLRIDGGGNNKQWTTSYEYPLNTWFHLIVTCENGMIRYYINGEYQDNYGLTLDSSQWGNTFSIGVYNNNGAIGSSNYFNGKLNDVRIYNHCLSAMEVKKLAQGLILHYPLNRNGWGQENLADSSYSDWSSWITPTANSQNQTSYAGYVYWPEGYTRAEGDKFACQIEVEFSGVTAGTGGTFRFRTQGNITSGWVGSNPWARTHFEGTPPTNGIHKLKWVGTIDATAAGDDWLHLGFRADYWGSGKYRYRFIKFEKGEIATPWCPNSSEVAASTMGLNGTTEYDISGYGYNGTRIGTLEWTSDTPKYCVSTYFNGSSCIFTELPYLGNEWSYSCWIYSPTSSRSWEGVIILNTTGSDADLQLGFYTYPGGNKIQNTANGQYNSNIAWTYGVWHHFCGTFDGSSLKTYIDGNLVDTKSITNSLLERHMLTIGARRSGTNTYSTRFQGNLSDCRIYATVLSADDVKSLYQNCATIGPDGTIYGKIR